MSVSKTPNFFPNHKIALASLEAHNDNKFKLTKANEQGNAGLNNKN